MRDGEPALLQLTAICEQAARRHGSEWERVRQDIRSELAQLPPAERAAIEGAVELMLSRETPERPTTRFQS